MSMVADKTKPWHACPECGSPTLLYLAPGEWAGIWECTNQACGVSDSCEHPRTDTETITIYQPSPIQIDTGTDRDEEIEQEICLDCGVVIEN